METDELHKRVYISNASKKSTASPIYKSKNGFRNNLRGAFLTHINHTPVFSKLDAIKQLKLLKDRGVQEFSITFAPERPITGKKLRRAIDDYHHFSPGTTKRSSRSISRNQLKIWMLLMIIPRDSMWVLLYSRCLVN